ncbi:Vps53-like protein [Schizophyllum amplum]|uniref:Vps53-like protein n=1 Tax=Schizophyllum amplum TaxID=97359 RepID=A0A550CZ22_9AGAR|nr:Vps53-like protein [Auriculariopsis ampla]
MPGELPPELLLSIQRVLELKDDPDVTAADALGSNFAPVDALNNFFPDEASLANLDAVRKSLADDRAALEEEIAGLRDDLKREQDPSKMQLLQEMISDLLHQMARIRENATESEAVVRNITKDIQVLDLAKKNLIHSMTTLKRLQMLVNALTQVEGMVPEKRYAEIAQTLAAVKQISNTFRPYITIPRIAQIWKRMQELQGRIRGLLDEDFDAFFMQDTTKPVRPTVMADACLVADVLGPDVRAHLVDRYVALEIKDYRRIFRPTDEAGQLDNLARRFSWFHRLLQTHELEQGRVFPSEWRVGWYLAARFADITRDDLAVVLSKAAPTLTAKSLLENLELTTNFEAGLAKKWATPFQEILDATNATTQGVGPRKPISAAFEPHMGVFIDAQDKALGALLAPHRSSTKGASKARPSLDVPSEGDADDGMTAITVLPSSTELFHAYAGSLEQCAKLSTGKPLFDLAGLHKKWLKIYAEDVLIPGLKATTPRSRKSTESRMDDNALKQACLIINTADYCQTTAAELEEKMRENIDEAYKEQVSFQAEADLFVSVISAAIAILLHELEVGAEPGFLAMTRTSWASLQQVTGPSLYTSQLVTATEQAVGAVKPLVEQKRYLRNFFDKAASLILAKFTNALVKSRPIKETGAEQLLIDLQVLKAHLLKLPGDLVSSGYTKSVNKATTRLETLLKVVMTLVDPPEGFILNYTVLVGDASFSNFQKILDLKGTPKGEQNTLLDQFLTITSTKPELEGSSFLTSLDMDPQTSGLAMASPRPLHWGEGGEGPGREGIFAGLASPPPQSVNTADGRPGEKREVFSDIRRFVSFGLRRDTQGPA